MYFSSRILLCTKIFRPVDSQIGPVGGFLLLSLRSRERRGDLSAVVVIMIVRRTLRKLHPNYSCRSPVLYEATIQVQLSRLPSTYDIRCYEDRCFTL